MSAVIGSLRAELSATVAKFQEDLGKAADAVSSLSKQATIVARDFKKAGNDMQAVGTALAKTVTLPLVAIGAAAAKAGKDFDEALDDIRATTGKTGADLDALGASFRTVFKGVPADAAAVASAIGDLASRTGLVGAPLEALTTQLLNLSRLTKTDIGPLVENTTRVFGAWKVSTDAQAGALDFLFSVSQRTGIGVGKLTDELVSAAPQMQALGFSFQESAVLLGGFEKQGVDADTVLSGLRIAAKNYAKENVDLKIGLGETIQKIQDLGSGTAATKVAIDTFGKAGIAMADAILKGRLSVTDLVDSIRNGGDTINTAAKDTLSFADKWLLLKNNVEAALEPLGAKLLGIFERFQPTLLAIVNGLSGLIDKFAALPGGIQDVLIGMAGFAALIGPATFLGGQAVSSIGAIIASFGKAGVASRTLIGAIEAISTALKIATSIEIGGGALGVFVAAGGFAALFAAGTVAGKLWSESIVRGLEDQAAAAKKAGTPIEALTGKFKDAALPLDDLKAKAKDFGQDVVTGLTITLRAAQTATPAVQTFADKVAALVAQMRASKDPVKEAADAQIKYADAVQTVRTQISGAALTKDVQTLAAAFNSLPATLKENDDVIGRVADSLGKMDQGVDGLPPSLRAFVTSIQDSNRVLQLITKTAGDDVPQAFGQAAYSLEQLQNIADGLTFDGLPRLIDGFDLAGARAKVAADELDRLKKQASELAGVVARQGVGLAPAIEGNVKGLDLLIEKTNAFGTAVASTLAKVPDLFKAALTGGGGLIGALQALLVDFASQVGEILSKKIAGSLSGALAGNQSGSASIGTTAVAGGAAVASAGVGAATGATAGIATAAVTAGVTLGISAAVIGGIALYKKLATPEWKKLGSDIGRDFGVNLSDEALKALEPMSKAVGRQATELFALGDIIRQAGGVAAVGIDKVTAKARDLFVMLDTGKLTVEQVGATFNDVFGQLAQTVGPNQLISKGFQELIGLAKQLGDQVQSVKDFVSGQVTSNILPGLGAFTGANAGAQAALDTAQGQKGDLTGQLQTAQQRVADARSAQAAASLADAAAANKALQDAIAAQDALQGKLDTVNATIATQQGLLEATGVKTEGAAAGLAAAALAAFTALQQSGKPVLEIVRQMDPIISNLQKQFQAAGLTGGTAFDLLKERVDLAKDAIAGPVYDAVAGLGQALVGLNNIGELNQDTFSGLTDQIAQGWQQLVLQGRGGAESLKLLQGPLQQVWQLQQQFGFAVSDGVQSLLDQAEAAGIVGEKQKPIQEQMLDATLAIAAATKGIAVALDKLTPAAQGAASGLKAAFSGVRIDVPVNLVPGTGVQAEGQDYQPQASYAGGSGGIRDFGVGTLAMLHGREAVFTEAQLNAMQAPSLDSEAIGKAIAKASRGGQSVVVLPLALDASGRTVAITRQQRDAIQREFTQGRLSVPLRNLTRRSA